MSNRRAYVFAVVYLFFFAYFMTAGLSQCAQEVSAGERGFVTWRHDRDELFVTSHAPRDIRVHCRWYAEGGWVYHGRHWFQPGETGVWWTKGQGAHGFDCWRTT